MSSSESQGKKPLAHYFVAHPQVSWVLLVLVVLGGVLGYQSMAKRKDPEIPVHVAAAAVAWPGARAELIEQAITRRVEAKIAENTHVERIDSTTRTGIVILQIRLTPDVEDTGKEFDDIKLRIDSLRDLPKGSYPPQFMKDFGDTVALMLTVASPPTPPLEIALRAKSIRQEIETARGAEATKNRVALVLALPPSSDPATLDHVVSRLEEMLNGKLRGISRIERKGFVVLDGTSDESPDAVADEATRVLDQILPEDEQHPDLWSPVAVGSLDELEARLAAVAGPRYSFRELDDMTDRIGKHLQRVPDVAKVARVGLQSEQFTLEFSQEKLAGSGVDLPMVANAIAARNINLPAGTTEALGRSIAIRASGELQSDDEIKNILLTTTAAGSPVYLRDVFDVRREYQRPRLLNELSWRNDQGQFQTSRAITMAVSMRSGSQIAAFGKAVDAALTDVRSLLPNDLVLLRTSDQPRQVEDNVTLFTTSLYEAIALVVIVALIGFWSVRTAAILALAIPVTLAMTYGVMNLIHWDIQQISIATMILALGLLVDVPVVASDAIVSGLSRGEPREEAAWKGPTRLSVTILFATLTNVVAYLPFLSLSGDTGRFIRSLPVVMTIALLSAWVLSLTFVPTWGALFLSKPKKRGLTPQERRKKGFGKVYAGVVGFCIRHRLAVLGCALGLCLAAIPFLRRLPQAFFPKDLSYLSYVDVWLPEDSTLTKTRETADRAGRVIESTLEAWGKAHASHEGKPRQVLRSLTTFVGGGGPRFWFSVVPEQQQANYAQIIIEVNDKHDTNPMVADLQRALESVPGARIDVRQLETGKPVGVPVSIRLSGEDIPTLRKYAERAKNILEKVPFAERVRDDWGTDALTVDLDVDTDRANLMGFTNYDVALSSLTATSGQPIASVRRVDDAIPVVARMRSTERATVGDLANLYVSSAARALRAPLGQVAKMRVDMAVEKIQRRNHMRTITVSAFPSAGRYASEVMAAVRPEMQKLASELPPGYEYEVGGEEEEQVKGFKELTTVLVICIACIFLALTVQFKSAVKPIIVFATIPLGVIGALASLVLSHSPFGFMAFLGIISLIGIIVSHVIVLFDFIEERREDGESLENALIDAGIQRLRPVLITVVATVIALFPLAAHGGPLWEPLCYAQIGGLSIATFVTLLIVPVMYAVFVRDLKLMRWATPPREAPAPSAAA